MHRLLTAGWRGIGRLTVALALAPFWRVRTVAPLQRMDGQRLLMLANHESQADALLLALRLAPELVWLRPAAAPDLPWWLRGALRWVGADILTAGTPGFLHAALRAAGAGRPLLAFPEGMPTTSGALMKVYPEAGWAAARLALQVVPVTIDGTAFSRFGQLDCGLSRRFRARIRLVAHSSRRIEVPAGLAPRSSREWAAGVVRTMLLAARVAARPDETLWQGLCRARRRFGARRPVVEDVLTPPAGFGGLIRPAVAIGRVVARQTKPGERVGVLLPNLVPTLAALFGLTAYRREAALLNPSAGREVLAHSLAIAGIRCVLTSRRFLDRVGLTETVAAWQDTALVFLEDLPAQVSWSDRLAVLAAMLVPERVQKAVDPAATALVMFTSGSEGLPKGVQLSHRALMTNVAQGQAAIDLRPTDRGFNALPLFHSFGLTGGALIPLLSGMPVVLYPSPLHYRTIPEAVYRSRCTVLFGTSSFLLNYARYAQDADFLRLRYVCAGGERLTAPVQALWQSRFGLRILEGYGLTEAAPVLALNTPAAFRPESVGQLLPGIRGRVEPVEGIARGGMLWVCAENWMNGYLGAVAAGADDDRIDAEGKVWHATGDVAEIDADGFVYIVGRLRRFAKVAGEMVSLETTERIAQLVSPQAHHAALSEAEAERGEAIVLYTTDAALVREALRDAAQQAGIPPIALPRRLVFLPELPVMPNGKTDYRRLAEMKES